MSVCEKISGKNRPEVKPYRSGGGECRRGANQASRHFNFSQITVDKEALCFFSHTHKECVGAVSRKKSSDTFEAHGDTSPGFRLKPT